jgi:hypothetical protein
MNFDGLSMHYLAIPFITVLVLTVASARSETEVPRCMGEPVHVDPAQNDTVYLRAMTPAGQSCSHFFAARGLVAIEQVDIVAKPRFGSLDRAGDLRLVYRPKSGFTGQDTYMIRLCGSSLQGKGCTTVIYAMTVQ